MIHQSEELCLVVERQRRFLLNQLPPELTRASAHIQITDNYITATRLRLRKVRTPATRECTWHFQQKFASTPSDLSRTLMTDIQLTQYEYDVFSVFEGNEIRKNRYPYEHQGRAYNIDLFLGPLWGLIMAETSFETDEEMDRFTLPPFAIRDVSQEELFTGGKLAHLTIEEIRAELKRRASQNA